LAPAARRGVTRFATLAKVAQRERCPMIATRLNTMLPSTMTPRTATQLHRRRPAKAEAAVAEALVRAKVAATGEAQTPAHQFMTAEATPP
jgi:hypothetical protein